MDLIDYRNQLDVLDAEITKLFCERSSICDGIANYKIEHGLRVLDKTREKAKLTAVGNLADTEYNCKAIQELYEQIMCFSRKRQYQLLQEAGSLRNTSFIPVDHLIEDDTVVVYQGAAGSYSEAAMKKFFGKDIKNFNVDSFRDAMVSIEEGAADFAVLPVENSTAGIVNENYDLLAQFENYIVGEETIPIRHCLMGVEGTTEETIRKVYSHAQSLMQCQQFLSDHPMWEQVSSANNAFAAQKVAKDNDITKAAIASEFAAEAYGLKILKKGVNFAATNSTRFIIVSNRKMFLKDAKKISICIEMKHDSGASSGSLYKLLSHLYYNHLNMTLIESRPIPDRDWEYRFFIDFEGNLNDAAVRNALRGLRDEAGTLKILGNY